MSRVRTAYLVGLLAFASGGVDVVTLMALGGSFTSVITGNLIFVGRAAGTSALTPAVNAISAVVGYMIGVAVGARLAHALKRPSSPRHGPAVSWPPRATIVLGVECVVLAVVNVAWICYRADPPAQLVTVLLAAAALALGMQGAAARTIAGNPSTTYMTGALTTLIEALVTRGHRGVDWTAPAGLAALIAGAACGAALIGLAPRVALLPPLAAIALVIAVKTRHHRSEEEGGRRGTAA